MVDLLNLGATSRYNQEVDTAALAALSGQGGNNVAMVEDPRLGLALPSEVATIFAIDLTRPFSSEGLQLNIATREEFLRHAPFTEA